MSDPIKLGILGIDHGHIFGMLGNMMREGCTCTFGGPMVRRSRKPSFVTHFPIWKRSMTSDAFLMIRTSKWS